MTKLGVFVGERGLWHFFEEIYADLNAHYETAVFAPKQYRLPFFSERINRWSYHYAMRSLLKECDVCFFEWASEMLEVASHMPKYSPIIARLHSFELADWVHRINWDHVDKIIFISEAIRQKFIARYGAHAEKTVVVQNSISVKKFSLVQRPFDFSLGMLCAIVPIKRVYEVILVIKELRDQGYNPTLHIAGSPHENNYQDRYYQAVHGLVEKLDLQNNVKFYGHVNTPSAWFGNIDIFISNSFWEGMQTALLEAMASGCYCLGHFWDGVEEVLPAENVYGTDTELKQKLIAYLQLSDHERMERKKQLARIVDRKFNLEDKKVKLRNIVESFR